MVHLRTIQALAFKTMFEVMKDIVTDVNLLFYKDGMRLTTLDASRVSLIDVYLPAESFEDYNVENVMSAGVNISNMSKLLKSVSSHDIIEIFIDDSDCMKIELDNEQKKTKTKFVLKLMDLDEDEVEIDNFNARIISVLNSQDFQKICRDMKDISKNMKIKRFDNFIEFSCDGDFVQQNTIVQVDETIGTCIEDIFCLKYLNAFTKATVLGNTVQLIQDESGKPLVVKYNVANLGEISFYIVPKIEDI